MITLWLLAGVLGQAGEGTVAEPPLQVIGGGFTGWVHRRANLKVARIKVRPAKLKTRYFPPDVSKRIDLDLPEVRPVTVARIAPQPIPILRPICQPVFDKRAVIEKRNRQIEAMFAAADRDMMDRVARFLEAA
jgi:hypothetical protein